MAGGSGTCLWPVSSFKRQKQFLPFDKNNNETSFSLSLERSLQIVGNDKGRVIIIAGKFHVPFIITACSELSIAEKNVW